MYGKKNPTRDFILCLHHQILTFLASDRLDRGSAATGLACAISSVQGSSFLGIPSELFLLGYVASLATKLSDTFASEIGKAYGKTTFLITTLERVEPGTEGLCTTELFVVGPVFTIV
jgi:uncharacterized protein (TIGR00297 family)